MKKKIMIISQRPCFPHGMGGAQMSITLLLLRLKEIGNPNIIAHEKQILALMLNLKN
jgi:hypothetical protein